MAVLMTGMLVLSSFPSLQVLRRSTNGWLFAESCFFFTGKEDGFSFDIGSISVSIHDQRFCGLTIEQVQSALSLAKSKSESTDFFDQFTGEYFIQFFCAVGYAMFFVGMAVLRVASSAYKQDKSLDNCTFCIKQALNMLVLTLLAGYLAFPLGSVRSLPEPADQVYLVRTPPDYATVQIYMFFVVCPFLCCLPVWEDTGTKIEKCMLCTCLLVALPILACVISGYWSMAIFYLDFEFTLSFDLRFVIFGTIAKFFLWTVAFIDAGIFLVDVAHTWIWRKQNLSNKMISCASSRQ
eukprot:Skav212137  [mRNA]  locus=scaffold1323:260592:261473:- [translate_table: standard]